MEILKPQIEYGGLADLVAVGVVKQMEEKLTSPIIGNGTLMSGGVKLILGSLSHGKMGRIGNVVSSAFLVDAGEDLAMGLMGMLSGAGIGGGGNTQNDEWS